MSKKPHNPIIHDPGHHLRNALGIEPTLAKRILKMAWPVVLGMLTQSAINTIDIFMVGHLPEEYAVPGAAAIMTSLILLWGFGGSLSAISVGTQALCARRFSQHDNTGAGKVLLNAIVLGTLGGIGILIFSLLTLDPLLSILTPSETVRAYASSYSQIRLFALLSMGVIAAYKSFYDGIGQVRIHMYVAIFMNVVNVPLNYVFMYGYDFGFYQVAAYNVDGAAIGSILSSYLGLIVMGAWAFRPKDLTRYRPYRLKNIDKTLMYQIFSLSFWAGMATLILTLGAGLFNYVVGLVDTVNGLPDVNAAASGIIINILLLIFMCSLAMGIATSTLVSQSIGANQYHLAERYCWQAAKLCTAFILVIGILGATFPEFILQLFMPDDVGANNQIKDLVVETAVPSFRLVTLVLAPLSAAGLIFTQCLYAAGENRFVTIAEFLLHFCVFVPLAWFFAIYLGWDLLGCWISGTIYATLLAIATGIRFNSGIWKHQRL